MKVITLEAPPPLECLIRAFGRQERAFVLDSAQHNDGLGEWTFFGAAPRVEVGGSLAAVSEALEPCCRPRHPSIPFTGGAVGYIAYDYGRRLEQLPDTARDERTIRDLRFGIYDAVAAYSHRENVLHLVAHDFWRPAATALAQLRSIIEAPVAATGPMVPSIAGNRPLDWSWNLTEEAYLLAVRRIKEWIAAGDVYQVNLSRCARAPYEGDTVELYLSLRAGNPAPYSAYLDVGELKILSTSPEQFLRKRGDALVTRPIKGTRPRGRNAREDAQQAASLRLSEKDRAELLMIVDLERNDLGRVAAFGSVRVEGMHHQERYARVMHQTARVHARLASGKTVYDALEALFPGGSITGAPKIRAMEIIEALEPTRRGVYCGSIGYIGFDGDAEFNIAIRTLQQVGGFLDYQVGGGIVWDSSPEAELQETLDKGRAIRETLDKLWRQSP